jgi:hypothetical protein
MSFKSNDDFQKQHEALITEALKCKACTLDTIVLTLDLAHHQMAQMYVIESTRSKMLDGTMKKALKDGVKIEGN